MTLLCLAHSARSRRLDLLQPPLSPSLYPPGWSCACFQELRDLQSKAVFLITGVALGKSSSLNIRSLENLKEM